MRLLAYSLGITILLPLCSEAQQTPPPPAAAVQPETFSFERCTSLITGAADELITGAADELQEEEAADTPLGAGTSAPTLSREISLLAGEEGGRAFFSYSGFESNPAGVTNTLAAKVHTPFNKEEGEGILVPQSDLKGDVVAGLTFSRHVWDLELGGFSEALCRACAEAKVESLNDCNLQTLGDRGVEGRKVDAIQDALFGRNASYVYSLAAEAGYKDRAYFDLAGTKRNDDRLSYSASLVAGMIKPSSSYYLKLTGKHSYKENDKVTKCAPVEGSELEQCEQQPLDLAVERMP